MAKPNNSLRPSKSRLIAVAILMLVALALAVGLYPFADSGDSQAAVYGLFAGAAVGAVYLTVALFIRLTSHRSTHS